MLSFAAIWILRLYDTKKFIDMQTNWALFFANLSIIAIQIFILMIGLGVSTEIIIGVVLFSILLLINKDLWKLIFKMITKIKKNKN